jgi:hypothetical protein
MESLKLLSPKHPRWKQLSPSRPRQHLEVTVELADILTQQGEEPRVGVRLVTRALALAAPERRVTAEPIVRAHALYHSARFLTVALADGLGGDQVPAVVPEIADELGGATALFESLGPLARALRLLLLGELRMLDAVDEAVLCLDEAHRQLVALGASASAAEAEDFLKVAERLAG